MPTNGRTFRSYTLAELAAYKEPELVRYSGGKCPSFDVLTPNGCWYEIEEHRCDTAPRLVEWIAHMTEKVWFTADHARQLIALVNERHPGVREYGC